MGFVTPPPPHGSPCAKDSCHRRIPFHGSLVQRELAAKGRLRDCPLGFVRKNDVRQIPAPIISRLSYPLRHSVTPPLTIRGAGERLRALPSNKRRYENGLCATSYYKGWQESGIRDTAYHKGETGKGRHVFPGRKVMKRLHSPRFRGAKAPVLRHREASRLSEYALQESVRTANRREICDKPPAIRSP